MRGAVRGTRDEVSRKKSDKKEVIPESETSFFSFKMESFDKKKKKIKNTPLTNYEGEAGPSAYKISKDADVTVLMWVNGQVKVNHAFKKSDLSKDKISELVKETSKILN
ncbi:MAG: hypothetical protein KDA70_17045 [Planctomycetaceae bacterium]|nr:hypothetical protein [Planctomycetaceae bacterium]